MAFLPDATPVTIEQFSGAWVPSAQLVDAEKIPLINGRLSENMRFFGSNTQTRFGYQVAFSPANIITALINWLFLNGTTPANYAAFYVPGVGLRIANLASPTASTVMTETTGATASLCTVGARIYSAFMDSNGIGVAQGQVYGFGVGADPLFAAPIATSPTFSELGGTFTTVGAKRFGYLIQTRNGYITKPSPATGTEFTAASYTSLGGAILMSVDPPSHVWPSYALNVAPIMTTTANPNRFFIVPPVFPGGSSWFPVSGVAPTLMLIEATDDQLTANGIDATPYLNQLGQTVSGVAPIKPSVIAPYGQRIAYQCLDAAGVPVTYFSDSSQPQSINAATSGVYLPGNLSTTSGNALRETFYIFGPHWTYASTDSNGDPVTWAQPQLVDGSIGAAGPFCVALSATQNFLWVVDEAGLYLFQGGSYAARPVSYWQSATWQRINFAATTKIMVVDHKSNQRVIVIAPLDGATTPTHSLSWDYSLGQSPEEVQFTLNSLAGYEMGAVAMMQNNTTKHVEPWLAPSSASYSVLRENDGTEDFPFRDVDQPINSTYEYAPVPRDLQGNVIMHHGAQIRVRGSGTLNFEVFSLDQQDSVGPWQIPLSETPNSEILQRFYIRTEMASGRFNTNALDEWFNLSRVDHYFTTGSPSR
jgi:hypothetical protein